MIQFRRLAVTSLLGLASLAAHATMVSYTVNTTADTEDALVGDSICADASGKCSLRAAIMETGASAASITLPPGRYALQAALGRLAINGFVTIRGTHSAPAIIDAQRQSEVFAVMPGHRLDLHSVHVRNGYLATSGGCIGVYKEGVLTLRRVIVGGCESGGDGGGIANMGGILDMQDAVVQSNRAAGNGGGIFNGYGQGAWGTMTATRSTVSGNTATGYGGGIANFGDLNYHPVTRMDLTNVTISGNTGGANGAGLMVTQGSRNLLVNVTVSDNRGPQGYSGAGVAGNGAAAFAVRNSIFSGNYGGYTLDNCYQFGDSSAGLAGLDAGYDLGVPVGYNVSDSVGYCGFTEHVTQGDPKLGPLAYHGGFAPTHVPGTASAAVGAGDPANSPSEDARGLTRPQAINGGAATPDAGAVEVTPPHSFVGPALTSPANGAHFSASTSLLQLIWSIAMPGSGTLTYRVEVSDAADFPAPAIYTVDGSGALLIASAGGLGLLGMMGIMVPVGGLRRRTRAMALAMIAAAAVVSSCSSGTSVTAPTDVSTSFSLSGLEPGTTYYWRVIADDGSGGTATSETRSFTIDPV